MDSRYAQLARAVLFHAERRRHAAIALDAILESDAGQIALQVVTPGVIHAGEVFGFTTVLQGKEGATMRAAILEGVEFAVAVAGHDNRGLANETGLKVAGLGNLSLEAKIIPVRPLEQPRLFILVHSSALKSPVGHTGQSIRPQRVFRYSISNDVHFFSRIRSSWLQKNVLSDKHMVDMRFYFCSNSEHCFISRTIRALDNYGCQEKYVR